jgi:hypothetical protein
LEDHVLRLEGGSDFPGLFPGPGHLLASLKRAASGKLIGRPAKLQAAIGRALGLVGDQLPGFQSEFKIRRRLFPPFFRSFQGRGLVESLLHFHSPEDFIIFTPGLGKSAATNPDNHKKIGNG